MFSKEKEILFDEAKHKYIFVKHPNNKLFIMFIISIVVIILSFSLGRFYVPPLTVLKILLSKIISIAPTWESKMYAVVISIRFPRIMSAFLIGAALSVSGCVYQGMFKNPMVSPDILGSSMGSGFGAALGILLGFNAFFVSASAFCFGLLSVLLAILAANKYKANKTLGLVLAGIMISSLFSASTSFIKLIADPNDQLPSITYYLMGSLASIKNKDLIFLIPLIIIGIIPLNLMSWRLNILTLNDDEAKSIGVNTKLLRIVTILCSTLITSASVSVSGMIGFIGLVVPHFVRKIIGCNFKYMIPSSIMIGGTFLLIVDNFARLLATKEIPIGILTAFIGTPFFISLLTNGDKHK